MVITAHPSLPNKNSATNPVKDSEVQLVNCHAEKSPEEPMKGCVVPIGLTRTESVVECADPSTIQHGSYDNINGRTVGGTPAQRHV